ncbi:MAG: hypothetical protein R2764_16660 [Bacteroidales bacterium]
MGDAVLDVKLLLFDSSKRTIDMATALVGNDPLAFKKILDFALKEKEEAYLQRAGRVLNQAVVQYPELITPYIDDLIFKLDDIKSIGLKRSLAKTLAERSFEMGEETVGVLADKCFRYVNDPSEQIALRVYSMEILYKISVSFPELKQELISSIENQVPHSTVAIKSRGKRLLKKLLTGK